MARKSNPIRRLLNPRNFIIPIVFGLVVVGYMIYNDFDPTVYSKIEWSWASTGWLFLALLMVACRDIGYMYRIRVLTDKALSWRRSFDVIMLWEFASSITPSVVGGSGVAIIILNREGISMGRSTAVVMITAFLDELFYVLMVPIMIALVGTGLLFPEALEKEIMGMTLGTKQVFVIGYTFIVGLISMILYAIFINPVGTKKLLGKIFKLSFLKKWQEDALKTGDDIIITSKELKGKPWSFWWHAFGATFLSWTARFWVVNFLIVSFSSMAISLNGHFLIYAKQLVMWVILLISPTPGGAGVAEAVFSVFLKDFVEPEGITGFLSLLWRLVSYYPYLIMGILVLPGWISRVYLKRKLIKFKSK